MTMMTGRASNITMRDGDVFLDLYLARIATTKQISEMHFPALSKAKDRLAKLTEKGWIKNNSLEGKAMWILSGKGFQSLNSRGFYESRPEFIDPVKLPHHLDTVDFYVKIRQTLTALFGDPDDQEWGWEWVEEGRADRRYEVRGKEHHHRPDAEVRFREHVFYIERETKRSRATERKIHNRVAGYKLHMDHYEKLPFGQARVLYVCDNERDAIAAANAGTKYQVPVYAYDLKESATYLLNVAYELV